MMSTLFALRWPFRCSVLAVCACAVFTAPPLLAHASDTLTQKDIEDAIRWGMDGDPTPYLLHHEGPPGNANSVIVGAIYTPFLRVALAAKAARSAGHDFASEDVTRSLIEPVIYVAFRWYCCVDPDHGNDLASWNPSTPPVDYKIAMPGDRVARHNPRLRVTMSPLSTSRDISLLARFGGELPYRDVVLIATYPTSVLAGCPNFVIYREWPSSVPQTQSTGMIVGQVTPEDLTRWR